MKRDKGPSLKATGEMVGDAVMEFLARQGGVVPPPKGECRCMVTCQGYTEGCRGLKKLDDLAASAGVNVEKMNAIINAKEDTEVKTDPVPNALYSAADVEKREKQLRREQERREFEERVAKAVEESAPIRSLLVDLARKILDGSVDNEQADRVLKIVDMWKELT